MRLTENTKIVVKKAINATGAIAATDNAVNMAGYNRCRIILTIACDNNAPAAGAVTLLQGVSAAACSTALAFSEYWKNADVMAADTFTHVTAATLAIAGIQNKTAMYIFEVSAAMLNSDTYGSENTYVGLAITDTITATEVESVLFELYEPRIALGGDAMPSAW